MESGATRARHERDTSDPHFHLRDLQLCLHLDLLQRFREEREKRIRDTDEEGEAERGERE